MIQCVKIAKYELRPEGVDIYDYLVNLAAGKEDPPSLAPGSLPFPGHVVFHSPLRRAVECVDCSSAIRCEPRTELAEVSFDMRACCDKATWEQEGSIPVRRGFKAAFIADTLLVPRSRLLEEIGEVLADARAIAKTTPVALVSHSFRLKLIEAYLGTKGMLEDQPELIHDYIHDDQKTYSFGEGFTID